MERGIEEIRKEEEIVITRLFTGCNSIRKFNIVEHKGEYLG